MLACAHCHSQIPESSRFCSVCGCPNLSAATMRNFAGRPVPAYPLPQHHAGHFGQAFGLDPRVALLTIVVDSMLFGGQLATLGASIVLSVPAGIALGLITYKAQRHWYGDDRESALIKGLIVGLLTAIPTSLPGFLTIPSGIVGLAHLLRRKKAESPLMINRTAGS